MRISLSEFREMIEEHSQEIRQAQDDYNLMADEKNDEIKQLNDEIKQLNAEIKRLDAKAEAALEALEKFHNEAYQLLKIQRISSEDLSTANCQLDSIYKNLLDGLDGY